jgi:hypothetical protein
LLHSDIPHQKADFRPSEADLNTIHLIGGLTVIGTNLLAGGWGGVAWLRQQPSVAFWYLLRVAQAAVVVQVLIGAALLLLGREADGLHYLYGVLPLVVSLLAEAARAGAAERELTGLDFEALPRQRQRLVALAIVRRETGIMALSALLITILALRAAETTPLLF